MLTQQDTSFVEDLKGRTADHFMQSPADGKHESLKVHSDGDRPQQSRNRVCKTQEQISEDRKSREGLLYSHGTRLGQLIYWVQESPNDLRFHIGVKSEAQALDTTAGWQIKELAHSTREMPN